MFEDEKKKIKAAIGRIEKIEVNYQSPVNEILLVMNKYLSTPADCAKHISEGVVTTSALALVDGEPWDMHKPLISNCNLKLLSMLKPEDNVINKAFWRTCSFLLGATIESAFKSDVEIYLHSFPVPNIRSGSFTYDVSINFPDWKPTDQEMRAMSNQFCKLINQELPIETIQVTKDVALDMFQENPFKSQQIPDIANLNDNKIVLYRAGNHVDISKGPMVGNSSIIGRCTVTAVHKLANAENMYRFQGVALPKGIMLNHFAYSIIENHGKKLNEGMYIPQLINDNVALPEKMSATN